MARITVEDCMHQVDNLFDLVLIASRRARQLANGADSELEWENDKPTVMALREIAEGVVNKETIEAWQQSAAEAEAERMLVAASESVGPPPAIPQP